MDGLLLESKQNTNDYFYVFSLMVKEDALYVIFIGLYKTLTIERL